MEQQQMEEQQAEASERPEFSNSEIEEMKTWFKFFDKNDDGHLDKEELKMVFHAMCWTVNEQEIDQHFKMADTDSNGFIDYNEYVQFLMKFRKDPEIERCELLEAFRHFDKDRSGTIDANEMRRFLMSKGLVYTDRDRREVEKLIKKADTDGSGSVDIEEFVNLMLEKPEASLYSSAKF